MWFGRICGASCFLYKRQIVDVVSGGMGLCVIGKIMLAVECFFVTLAGLVVAGGLCIYLFLFIWCVVGSSVLCCECFNARYGV